MTKKQEPQITPAQLICIYCGQVSADHGRRVNGKAKLPSSSIYVECVNPECTRKNRIWIASRPGFNPQVKHKKSKPKTSGRAYAMSGTSAPKVGGSAIAKEPQQRSSQSRRRELHYAV